MEQDLQKRPPRGGLEHGDGVKYAGVGRVGAHQRQERGVRNWRRYQAIRLLAQGQTPEEVAEAVGCRMSSVYNWVVAWKHRGNAGLHEEHHGGHMWRLDGAGQRELETLLETDPHERGEQATEWTVPCC